MNGVVPVERPLLSAGTVCTDIPLFGLDDAIVRVRGIGALKVNEYAPVASDGSNALAQIVYVPVVGRVIKPLPGGMREFVPPPPSSSIESGDPSGRFRNRKVSNWLDVIDTATC